MIINTSVKPEAPAVDTKVKAKLFNNMSNDSIRRLTANVISKPNLTDAEQRLGDYLMDTVR